jgi:hypothetical protein
MMKTEPEIRDAIRLIQKHLTPETIAVLCTLGSSGGVAAISAAATMEWVLGEGKPDGPIDNMLRNLRRHE